MKIKYKNQKYIIAFVSLLAIVLFFTFGQSAQVLSTPVGGGSSFTSTPVGKTIRLAFYCDPGGCSENFVASDTVVWEIVKSTGTETISKQLYASSVGAYSELQYTPSIAGVYNIYVKGQKIVSGGMSKTFSDYMQLTVTAASTPMPTPTSTPAPVPTSVPTSAPTVAPTSNPTATPTPAASVLCLDGTYVTSIDKCPVDSSTTNPGSIKILPDTPVIKIWVATETSDCVEAPMTSAYTKIFATEDNCLAYFKEQKNTITYILIGAIFIIVVIASIYFIRKR